MYAAKTAGDMKTFLAIIALFAAVSGSAALVAEFAGARVPTHFDVLTDFSAFVAVWATLVIWNDYARPRRELSIRLGAVWGQWLAKSVSRRTLPSIW